MTLVLAVVLSLGLSFVPTDAKANCFYPKRIVHKYYGYIYDSGNGGETPHCTHPVVGPPLPGVYPRTLVGEKVTECDGTVTQWGIECEDVEISMTQCDPICD